jgi:hypothetical protein
MKPAKARTGGYKVLGIEDTDGLEEVASLAMMRE